MKFNSILTENRLLVISNPIQSRFKSNSNPDKFLVVIFSLNQPQLPTNEIPFRRLSTSFNYPFDDFQQDLKLEKHF